MTITPNVSLFAQTNSQINRLNDLRSLMADLQRQATTQKKYDTLAGLGTQAFNVQRLRGDQPLLQSFLENIDKVSSRMELMNKSIGNISKMGGELVKAIQLQMVGGEVDMATIRQVAQQSLVFVQDMLNQNMDGHYLFAGSDITNPPFVDDSTLNSNFQNQITSWLAGGLTDAQLFAATDGFTAVNLGLSAGVTTAGSVTARIDHSLDIDYTIKADQQGFQDIIRALTFAANLQFPDEIVDVATQDQFTNVLDHILTVVTSGVEQVNDTNNQLASKFGLVKAIRENHVSDLNLNLTQVDRIENADPTTVLTSLQALQNQMQASYEVTRVVSQLSLLNFL